MPIQNMTDGIPSTRYKDFIEFCENNIPIL